MNDSVDDQDGSGEVRGDLAVSMSASSIHVNGGNTAVAAGYDYGSLSSSDPAEGDDYSEVYHAKTTSSGTKLRAVLVWDASTSCTNITVPDGESCTTSTLDADVDLYVYRHSDSALVAYSDTYASNYEFIEFAADANTEYDIKVYAYHWFGSSTYFGLSWLFSTYND